MIFPRSSAVFAIAFCSLATLNPVSADGLRALRAREAIVKQNTRKQLATFGNLMVVGNSADDGEAEDNEDERRLFYQGYDTRGFRIKARRKNDGKSWCMDAVYGTSPESNGLYPSVGFRHCDYSGNRKSQYFDALYDPDRSGPPKVSIETAVQPNLCLLVEDGKQTSSESGDRIRLGDCGDNRGNEFVFDGNINEYSKLRVAGNQDLCIVFEGNDPDRDDRMIIRTCRDSDMFEWKFETNYYDMPNRFAGGGDDDCVRVRGNSPTEGDRIVWDHCEYREDAAVWRMDTNGLIHSKLSDEMCMEAADDEEGAAIRLEPCDSFDSKQRFEFDGEDDPIYLKSKPHLYLQAQGNSNDSGDPMVLGRDDRMVWSPDAINP